MVFRQTIAAFSVCPSIQKEEKGKKVPFVCSKKAESRSQKAKSKKRKAKNKCEYRRRVDAIKGLKSIPNPIKSGVGRWGEKNVAVKTERAARSVGY